MNGFWDEPGAASGSPGSEDELLGLIDAEFPSIFPHLPFGRGHDCAELAGIAASPEKVCLALSTDLFLQDVHFSTRYFLPEEAGAKALTSAVSDLAAAGAAPLGFSLGLMLPPRIGVKTVSRMLSGMARKAREYGLGLSGGDLSRSDRIGFSVTLWGAPCESSPGFLRRGAARRGDRIFLVGQAGLARVGLWALEKYGRAALDRFPSACLAHLDPRPLLREGRILAALSGQSGERPALMDLSDGLLRDLPRLLKGLGANLDFPPDLFHREISAASVLMREPAAEIFLRGGEDYALLGVCGPELWPRVKESLPEAVLLGDVVPEEGVRLRGAPVAKDGFDHFSTVAAATAEKTGRGPLRRVRAGKKPSLWRAMARHGEKRPTRLRIGLPRPGLPPETGPAVEAIVAIGRRAGFSGLISGFNGNISARVALAGGSAACLITRAGVDKSALAPGDFVLLSLSGGKICGVAEASSESLMHLEIYRAAPGSRAVLHSHPPCLLALSLSPFWDKGFALPLPEVERYRAFLGVTPFFPPGTAELAAAVGRAAGEHAALWLTRHGLVTHGPDLAFVLSLTAELEQTAKMALLNFGLVPQIPPGGSA
ncbi:MAG: class II aldolase/adducin family protein [Desulfovibrio sp.]|nr:class II aldolase/adducin family protein [Desulfovibrio sp.]